MSDNYVKSISYYLITLIVLRLRLFAVLSIKRGKESPLSDI